MMVFWRVFFFPFSFLSRTDRRPSKRDFYLRQTERKREERSVEEEEETFKKKKKKKKERLLRRRKCVPLENPFSFPSFPSFPSSSFCLGVGFVTRRRDRFS